MKRLVALTSFLFVSLTFACTDQLTSPDEATPLFMSGPPPGVGAPSVGPQEGLDECAPHLAGTWDGTTTFPIGPPRFSTWVLSATGQSMVGTVTTFRPDGTRAATANFSGSCFGAQLDFIVTFSSSCKTVWKGTLEEVGEDEYSGQYETDTCITPFPPARLLLERQ